ncbi:MAG: hypothetical protein MHM6MM_003657 [Cercozoa sp. M6MM]
MRVELPQEPSEHDVSHSAGPKRRVGTMLLRWAQDAFQTSVCCRRLCDHVVWKILTCVRWEALSKLFAAELKEGLSLDQGPFFSLLPTQFPSDG